MVGILGEHSSDAECIKVLLKRILDNQGLSVKAKGFDGCGDLLKKGARHIALLANLGCDKFVVVIDADDFDGNERRRLASRLVRDADRTGTSIVVVPIQEIESWILADPDAISSVIKQLSIPDIVNPEEIESPKEWLVGQSKSKRSRPLYNPTANNPPVCCHINLETLARKCKSFRIFRAAALQMWAVE